MPQWRWGERKALDHEWWEGVTLELETDGLWGNREVGEESILRSSPQ